MTISASDPAAASDRLDRALALYRDLSVALRGQVDDLKATIDPKEAKEALLAHNKALQSVIDAEADLDKRNRAGAGGVELDLDSARAEILARLALRAAEG
jgi:hypothetical protein